MLGNKIFLWENASWKKTTHTVYRGSGTAWNRHDTGSREPPKQTSLAQYGGSHPHMTKGDLFWQFSASSVMSVPCWCQNPYILCVSQKNKQIVSLNCQNKSLCSTLDSPLNCARIFFLKKCATMNIWLQQIIRQIFLSTRQTKVSSNQGQCSMSSK